MRLTKQQLTQPRMRTLVLAIGLDPADVGEAVRPLIDDPRRTVVVTDALAALGELRALGVGVEHVPGRGSRQAELAGIPYERFLERRLQLIRSERPDPRQVIEAPVP
jgi:hypothetical protein